MNDHFIVVEWSDRRESLDECAARTELFFSELAHLDQKFSRWFRPGRSRKEALSRPVTTDAGSLRELLASGRNRTDIGRRVIHELGYSLSLWNGGKEGESIGVSIHCGCYGPWVGNFCLLEPPDSGPAFEQILRTPVLLQILTCMVNAWEPDSGMVASSSYLDLRPEAQERSPRIGWLVYLSHRLGRVPLVPAPATVVPVGTKGSIIITTPERFSVDNPTHISAADSVLAALEAAGLRS